MQRTIARATASVVGHEGHEAPGPGRVDDGSHGRVDRFVDRTDGVGEWARLPARRRSIVEAPEVMRDGVGLAEHDHHGIEALAREQPRRESGAAHHAVEQPLEGGRMPARPGRDLLEVGERQPADAAANLWPERRWMHERPVDSGRQRTVPAAHHDPIDRLGRVRTGHRQHGDAASGSAEAIPQGGHAPVRPVRELEVPAARGSPSEVEHAVPPRIDARHQRRPRGKRRRGHRRPERAPGAARHQGREVRQAPATHPRLDQIERRPVESDDHEGGPGARLGGRHAGVVLSSRSRGRAAAPA